MTENDLIELYCMIDDFIKHFSKEDAWKKLEIESGWNNSRGPKRNLSLTDVISLNLIRFLLNVQDLKSFHRLASSSYRSFFPNLPNYENFLKATNKGSVFLMAFVNFFLMWNRSKESEKVFYIDSTDLTVCKNRFISSHRVAKGFAEMGKTTKGWFYGFKLQGICDGDMNLVSLRFTKGSVHDNKAYEETSRGLKGTIVSDAGYLQKKDDLRMMFESGRIPFCATRKNMKRLVSEEQYQLLKKRNCIENVWNVLKNSHGLIYHKARSLKGMFRHFLYSILSFLIEPRASKKFDKHIDDCRNFLSNL